MTEPDVLRLGPTAQVTFQRAWRPDPSSSGSGTQRSTGTYPLRWIDLPAGGRAVALPVGSDEAVWLSLRAEEPTALQVVVDGIDALTGADPRVGLHADPQDYVVVPDQRWLDGVRTGAGEAASLLGPGAPAGASRLTLVARRLRAVAFAQWWTGTGQNEKRNRFGLGEPMRGGAAGGVEDVPQELVPDPFGLAAWDPDPLVIQEVCLLDPSQW